jgi:hypothetical protein
MSKDIKFDKESFLRLVLSNIEHNSSSREKAFEYLEKEGYDVEGIVSSGVARIIELQKKLASISAEQSNMSVKKTDAPKSTAYWTHPSVLKLMDEAPNMDPLDEIKSRARTVVIKAFEMGWQGPPYDPVALATLLNIDIVPNDKVTDARILPQPNFKFQIQYNPQQVQTRVNFSVAHEIAHTLFSDCANAIRYREEEPTENRQLERLCNAAAAEIQLPYAIFSHDADQVEPSMKSLIDLAKRYKASLESVFIRYTEVIDRPCAVIIGIFESENRIKLDYYTSSKTFPTKIPFGFTMPLGSAAFDCSTRGHTSEDTNAWEINGHKFHASCAGISAYRRENKPRVGVLLVPEQHYKKSDYDRRVTIEFGDATKPRGKGKKIIAQVVNDRGALGSGFGKSLSNAYPKVKQAVQEWKANRSKFVLGRTNLVEVDKDIYVFQMLAQRGLFATGKEVPLKYNDLRICLIELRDAAISLGASVHMPAIGSGHAGGDWNLIIGMIHDELASYDIKVCIYLLPGKHFDKRQNSTLTLFNEP